MQIANCRLRLDRFGSDVPLKHITPSEAQFLRNAHEAHAGTNPISHLEIVGAARRSNQEEIRRLKAKYGEFKRDDKVVIESLFPGVNPMLPKTFKEAGFEPDGNKVEFMTQYNPTVEELPSDIVQNPP